MALCFILLGPVKASATNVSGYVLSSTTWTMANSPYVVTGNLFVKNGATLTIEPGVTVKFNAGVTMQVDDATLIAQGTSTLPITLTSNLETPAAGDWGYLLFNTTSIDAAYDGDGLYTGGSILEYVILEYAGGASVSPNGALLMNGAHPFVNHCTVRDNKATGIYGYTLTGQLRIDDTVVESNAGSGIYAAGGTLALTGGTVNENSGAGMTLSATTSIITNSTVRYNQGAGITSTSGTLNVTNALIRNNNGTGISSTGPATIIGNMIGSNIGGGVNVNNAATITGNIIAGNLAANGAGINVSGSYTSTISNNTIAGNGASGPGGGVRVESGSTTVITGNTFFGNSAATTSALSYWGKDNTPLQHNTIMGNTAGSGNATIHVATHPLFNYNNIVGNTGDYTLSNGNAIGTADLNAGGNWWGTGDNGLVQAMINDGLLDTTKGLVDYFTIPLATAILDDAPISPPANVQVVKNGNGTVTVSWDANSEADVAGYRVHWGEVLSYPYANMVDAGQVTSYTLSGLSAEKNYGITVTAYDTAAETVVDDPATLANERQVSGNESWYSAEKQVVFVPTLPVANQDDWGWLSLNQDLTLGQDMTVIHDLNLNGGTLNLNGHTLTVKGSVLQSAGTLHVNGGKLVVQGDYRIQYKSSSGTYSGSSGSLKMVDATDLVEVGGSFVMHSYQDHTALLTAGILDVKGDFTQLSDNSNSGYNFKTSGTHKVVLSGSGKQTVSFANPGYGYTQSRFTILEITNSSTEGIEFSTALATSSLITNGHTIQLSNVSVDLTLQGDVTISGDVTLSAGVLDLNNHTLTVTGTMVQSGGTLDVHGGELAVQSLIQSGGTLDVHGGKLVVQGDYRIQYKSSSGTYSGSSGSLKMVDATDLVEVGGSFVMHSYQDHTALLTAGILDVKGDFTQLSDNSNSGYNFKTSGTHKVVLSGSGKQTVSFANPGYGYTQSRFTILEITNSSTEGIEFSTALATSSLITNGHTIQLSNVSVDLTLQGDATITGDVTLSGGVLNLNNHTLTVTGTMVQSGGTLDVHGGELAVQSLIQSGGTLDVHGGKLVVQGDYRLQYKSSSGTYSGSSGSLKMADATDLVEVGGSFVTESHQDHTALLTAGILDVKGDFTQLGLNSNFGSSFKTSGTHKVVLSGSGKQTVSFVHPGYGSYQSHFTILEITNKSSDQVTFATQAPTAKLITSNPVAVTVDLQHRHFRYGKEADYAVDLVPGATLVPLLLGDVALANSLGAKPSAYSGITWTPTDPAIVKADQDGVLTAVAVGQTTLSATYGEQSFIITVNVVADNSLPVMVLGRTGSDAGGYTNPRHLFAGKDTLYVSDNGNKRVILLDLAGNQLGTIQSPDYMDDITGLAVDAAGNIYVSDAATDQVHKFDSNGNHLLAIGLGGAGEAAGQFNTQDGLALDGNGNLWVTDFHNHRLQQFDATTGTYLGGFGVTGSNDNNLTNPRSVAVDKDGTLWIADNTKLKHFSGDGQTVLGVSADIVPFRLWLDDVGNIWVRCADYTIRKYDANLTELMNYNSSVDTTPLNDLPGTFDLPDGVTVDTNGNLWVAEWDNNRLQRIRFITEKLTLSTPRPVVWNSEQIIATATYGVTATVKPTENVNGVAQWSLSDLALATMDKGALSVLKTGPMTVGASFDGLSDTLALDLMKQAKLEVMPDNTLQEAMAIEGGKAIKGTFDSSSQQDWYAFATTSAGIYNILFSSSLTASFSADLEVVDAAGKTVYTATNLSNLATPIYLEGQTSYYLKLSGGTTNENYLVSFILASAAEKNIAATAPALSLGTVVNGVAAFNDANYYRLKLDGPKQLLINYAAPGSATTMQLSLFPEEISEATVLDRITSTKGGAVQIAIGLNQGTYYLQLTPSGNVDKKAYTLGVAPNQLATAGEFEPNNTLPFANTLDNGQSRTGRNYSTGDADFYTFHYTPDSDEDFLTLNFTPKDNKGSHTISLHNGEGVQITSFSAVNGAAISGKEFNVKPGQHFFKVEDANNNRTEYQLALSGKISAIKKVVGVSLASEKAVEEITEGDSVPMNATVYFSDGSSLENPVGLVWSCTAPIEGMTITNAGVLNVLKASSGSVVASYEGKVATLELSVGVVKKQSFGNLIIVAGGGIAPGNQLKGITQYLSDLTYQKFKGRGFGDGDIYYFNPIDFKDLDGNGFNDGIVDQTEITKTGFTEAISNWATAYPSTGPLYIYLNDHGANAQFQLFPNQILTASMLKVALDTFQAATNRAVVVIIEACHSGTFVEPLMAGATNRVVITSADQGLAFLGDGGSASFSQFFMGSLYKGASLSEAYDAANQALAALGSPYATMYPQVAPEALASSTQDFYVVGNFALAPMFPEISQTQLAATYDAAGGSGYTIQAKVTGVDNGKVWATVKPVNYTPPAVSGEFATPDIQLPMVDLLDAKPDDPDKAMDGVFDGTYAEFAGNGDYDVVIFARDSEGNITQTAVHKVTVTGLATANDYLSAGTGWSLLSSLIPFQAAAHLADQQKFTSAWKWESGSWAVYLAGEGQPGTYAASKGFTNLTTINPGEGFWVNSKSDQQLTITGTPATGALTFTTGWNLLGLKGGQANSVEQLLNGQSGIVSIWKWVVSGGQGSWAVYLASEGATQGAYAASKGFAILTTINPGEGFWVNKSE